MSFTVYQLLNHQKIEDSSYKQCIIWKWQKQPIQYQKALTISEANIPVPKSIFLLLLTKMRSGPKHNNNCLGKSHRSPPQVTPLLNCLHKTLAAYILLFMGQACEFVRGLCYTSSFRKTKPDILIKPYHNSINENIKPVK